MINLLKAVVAGIATEIAFATIAVFGYFNPENPAAFLGVLLHYFPGVFVSALLLHYFKLGLFVTAVIAFTAQVPLWVWLWYAFLSRRSAASNVSA